MSDFLGLNHQDREAITRAASIVVAEIWRRTSSLEFTPAETSLDQRISGIVRDLFKFGIDAIKQYGSINMAGFDVAKHLQLHDSAFAVVQRTEPAFKNAVIKARCADLCTALGAETASHMIGLANELSQYQSLISDRSRTVNAELLWCTAAEAAMRSIYDSLPLL